VTRRDDSVFFFTIVDLLIITIFLGLVLYVFAQKSTADQAMELQRKTRQLEALSAATGVSNITELTDKLTRLGPIKEIEAAVTAVHEIGGRDSLRAGFERLRKHEGQDLPPCLYELKDGVRTVTPLATVIAADSTISFDASTPQLEEVLDRLGITYEAVAVLSLAAFRSTFDALLRLRPDCRYTMTVIEQTKYVAARDAIGASFYHRFRRR